MAVVPSSSRGGSSTAASTLISTTTLGGAGTFDIQNIAGTYNDLQLVLIGRGASANPSDSVILTLNNDTGTNYNWERLSAIGAAASATESLADNRLFIGNIPASGGAANHFGVLIVDICGYASTSWQKVALARMFGPVANTTGNQNTYRFGGIWLSTTAITRVTLQCISTANFVAGSILRIYGIT